MAATYSVPTGGTTFVQLHRKVQGKLLLGYQNKCIELDWHTPLSDFTLAASLREVNTPIDIIRNNGGASIVEGGSEARPQTAGLNELTFTFIHRNYRYSFSRTAELLGKQGEASQVFDQLKYQARKQREAMCEHFSLATYGFSTGVVCQTTTAASQSSGTYTLSAMYGKSDLTSTTLLSQPFAVNARVALVRSGSLVTNAIGVVSAVGTGTITVTWAGSVTSVSGDNIVFAESLENTTLSGGTDYNKWPIGLLDAIETASVHGLSSSTAALWAGGSDTSGGRMNFVKLRKGQNYIKNVGGGEPDTFIVAQAVEADMTDSLFSTNRYATTMGMQLDGSTAIKGVKFLGGTRWTPNSRAWLLDSANLKVWHPVGQMPDENGVLPDSNSSSTITDKLQDVSGKAVGTDYIYARVFTNRGNTYMWSGLTEAY